MVSCCGELNYFSLQKYRNKRRAIECFVFVLHFKELCRQAGSLVNISILRIGRSHAFAIYINILLCKGERLLKSPISVSLLSTFNTTIN